LIFVGALLATWAFLSAPRSLVLEIDGHEDPNQDVVMLGVAVKLGPTPQSSGYHPFGEGKLGSGRHALPSFYLNEMDMTRCVG
jgi:hypothetical protein